MAEYVTAKYKVSSIKWHQRIRLFLLLSFLVLAILFLMGSYASVLGTICVVMFCYFIWKYLHWRKALKEVTKKKATLEGGY